MLRSMEPHDLTPLIRSILGEKVWGLDIDSKIRQAANEMSARVMLEMYSHTVLSGKGAVEDFANGAVELCTGDPGCLIGFDDKRWQDLPVGEEPEAPEISETPCMFHLRLNFTDREAAFYQFEIFPHSEFCMARKLSRTGACQVIRVELPDTDHLQLFVRELRHNPHLTSVDEITEVEFHCA